MNRPTSQLPIQDLLEIINDLWLLVLKNRRQKEQDLIKWTASNKYQADSNSMDQPIYLQLDYESWIFVNINQANASNKLTSIYKSLNKQFHDLYANYPHNIVYGEINHRLINSPLWYLRHQILTRNINT